MNTTGLFRFLRPSDVATHLGISRSSYYSRLAEGTLPPSVALGKRAAGHPEPEIAQVQAAIVRGADDTQLRALCRELVAARATA